MGPTRADPPDPCTRLPLCLRPRPHFVPPPVTRPTRTSGDSRRGTRSETCLAGRLLAVAEKQEKKVKKVKLFFSECHGDGRTHTPPGRLPGGGWGSGNLCFGSNGVGLSPRDRDGGRCSVAGRRGSGGSPPRRRGVSLPWVLSRSAWQKSTHTSFFVLVP